MLSSGTLKWTSIGVLGAALWLAPVSDADDRSEIDRRAFAWAERAYQNVDAAAALFQCREASRIAGMGGSVRAQMHAQICIGQMELRLSRNEIALAHYAEVLAVAESVGDDDYVVVALANESQVLIRLGLYDWALERILRGLNRLGPTGSDDIRSTLLNNQGVIARERGDYELALDLFERIEPLIPADDHEGRWLAICNRANTLYAAGKLDEALATLDAVAGPVRERGSARLVADLESIRGSILTAMGRHPEALSSIEAALESSLFEFQTAEILVDLARAQEALGSGDEARNSLEQALRISEEIDALGVAEKALDALLRYHTVRAHLPEALAQLERLSQVRRLRTEQEGSRRVAGLQALFEAEAKAREVEALREREKAKLWLILSLAAVLLLSLLILVQLWARYRSEARLHRRIRSDHRQLQRLNNDLVLANWRELGQMNRVSALGEMAAAFAHELRQPLTAIITNAQAAQRALPKSAGPTSIVGGAVDDTVRAARRAQELVRRLRRLLEDGDIQTRALDLSSTIREIEGFVIKEAELEGVDLTVALPSAQLPIQGDRIQLQQVVLNLVQNGMAACKDHPDGAGKLELRAAKRESVAVLEVEDTGPEIDEKTFDRMFEPLFTTKDHGMGMGLALCRTIAEAHGGSMSAYRKEGGGLIVTLSLPLRTKRLRAVRLDQDAA